MHCFFGEVIHRYSIFLTHAFLALSVWNNRTIYRMGFCHSQIYKLTEVLWLLPKFCWRYLSTQTYRFESAFISILIFSQVLECAFPEGKSIGEIVIKQETSRFIYTVVSVMIQTIDTIQCRHAPVRYKEDFSRSTEKERKKEKMRFNFLILYSSTRKIHPHPRKKSEWLGSEKRIY